MQVGILQQLGGCTFAGACRWVSVSGFGEDGVYVLLFAQGIAKAELLENPTLEGCGAFFPFLLQTFPLLFPGPDGSLELFDSFLLVFTLNEIDFSFFGFPSDSNKFHKMLNFQFHQFSISLSMN